jgi:starch phosphorylase
VSRPTTTSISQRLSIASSDKLDRDTVQRAVLDKLFYICGKFPKLATITDYYMALAYTVRDMMLRRWISTAAEYTSNQARTVAYLSAEYLMGPHLGNNLVNLGIYDDVREAMQGLGLNFELLLEQEVEPGLGNGGLGRLAACFIDSLATLEIPTLAYGIRYEFGIFDQQIVDGWQVEKSDKWLQFRNPWEIVRPEWSVEVKLGGHTEHYTDDHGRYRVRWVPERVVMGTPFDTPILGYRNSTANTLRLWRADAPKSFDFSVFNRGDYYGAVEEKIVSENLSKVLYPNDQQVQGKELRLKQQYFFVSCSLQDMFRILNVQGMAPHKFHEKFAVQLNDTHPAVAVAELMRLLVDKYSYAWERAWFITRNALGYTNHTLLPEALEHWPVELFGRVLPRHLEIILELNRRFLDDLRIRYLANEQKLAELSLIDETGERYVRMAHLACIGSHAVNGVAELHTELLKTRILKGFAELWPDRFSCKTNGVTPRRWMALANPRLTALLTEVLADTWIYDLDELREIEPLVHDGPFRDRWWAVKHANKVDVASRVMSDLGVSMDTQSIFDVQVKRIHEYKRQHLNILHIVTLYHRIKSGLDASLPPRTFIFGGKAAPGYAFAKLMIKLINSVGEVVNRDPQVHDQLKVVFLPNFNVKNGQHIYPAAEVSEQISTAGKEASGTGNMKFAMNGALTVGTMDGANIEIREEVGADNFFDFGLTTDEVYALQHNGYRPRIYYDSNDELRAVLDLLVSGIFSHGDTDLFRPIVEQLLNHDPYFVLADYRPYVECQQRVGEAYLDRELWTRMSMLNTARSGKFSSDRTIREYCREIWNVSPMPIELFSQETQILE